MIGFVVWLDRPVHPRGEVVLVGLAPTPNGRVVVRMPTAVDSHDLVFVFRNHIPKDILVVNPIGLTITYFREDRAFDSEEDAVARGELAQRLSHAAVAASKVVRMAAATGAVEILMPCSAEAMHDVEDRLS